VPSGFAECSPPAFTPLEVVMKKSNRSKLSPKPVRKPAPLALSHDTQFTLTDGLLRTSRQLGLLYELVEVMFENTDDVYPSGMSRGDVLAGLQEQLRDMRADVDELHETVDRIGFPKAARRDVEAA
jgi:hypothetical protein